MGNVNRKTVPMLLAVSLLGVGCSPSEPQIIDESKYEDLYDAEGLDDEEFPDPPELPDAVKDESEDGAVAAAEYFLDAYEYGFRVADGAPMEEIINEECGTCANLLEQFSDQTTKDISAPKAAFTDRSHSDFRSSGEAFYLVVETFLTNANLQFSNGEMYEEIADNDYSFIFELIRIEDEWRISGIDIKTTEERGNA